MIDPRYPVPTPKTLPLASLEAAATRPPAAGAFDLLTFGGVAAVTIAAFFGIGFFLLLHDRAAELAATAVPARSAAVPTAGAAAHPAAPPAAAAKAIAASPAIAPPAKAARSDAPAPPPQQTDRVAGAERTGAAQAPATNSRPLPAPAPGPAAAGAPGLPPSAGAAAGPRLSAEQIAALLADGDALFRRGDLAAARLSYLQAVAAGEGRGALGIGASYDPIFLDRFGSHAAIADLAEARSWYRRALALGAAEAARRLTDLGAKSSR